MENYLSLKYVHSDIYFAFCILTRAHAIDGNNSRICMNAKHYFDVHGMEINNYDSFPKKPLTQNKLSEKKRDQSYQSTKICNL